MRFAIDPWDPSYGMANEAELGASEVAVVLDTEVALAQWSPRPGRPPAAPGAPIAFVDGVRRVDARIWVQADAGSAGDDPAMAPGVCASWAAGAVCCEGGRAVIHPAAVEVGRTVAAPVPAAALRPVVTRHVTYGPVEARGPAPEDLWLAVQDAMGRAEIRIAGAVRVEAPDALVAVDGPLSGREHVPGVVGLVKTHHVAYLTGPAGRVLASLDAGERTPVFTITGGYARHSWYVRLPGAAHQLVPLAGVIRVECPISVSGQELIDLADSLTGALPRFASSAYKDRRAPQNLTPIAGLERRLRHLLGDPAVLYRSLRAAAAAAGA